MYNVNRGRPGLRPDGPMAFVEEDGPEKDTETRHRER